jgi:protein SCO1/2
MNRSHGRRLSERRAALAAFALAAPGLLLGAALAGCQRAAEPGRLAFKSMDITGAEFARKLALPDADGKPRTLDDFKGKVAVVFFGYAQCPDVCPTTMLQLAEVRRLLGGDGSRVQGVFVTVDPERDTPQVLKAYVENFDPGFVALRGTPEETAAAAAEFKVFFRKQPGSDPGSYTVDHTASSFVFDPQGRVRLYVRHGQSTADLAADIKQLLAPA